jgi:hypothetical protein
MNAVCSLFYNKFGKPTDVSMCISKNASLLHLFILYAQQFVFLAEVGFRVITGKAITRNVAVNRPGILTVFGTNQFSSSINPSKSKQA